jgi:hypothetical protein
MATVTRNGKEFKTRTLEVRYKDIENEEETTSITIAPESLSNELDLENDESDITLDEEIYFYVDDEHFDKSGEEICKNHLDEEMHFISEEE